MVLYEFYCPECGEKSIIQNPIDADFPPLSCDKCNVALKQKLPFLRTITCTSALSVQERCNNEARSDLKQIYSGNENKISDLVGDEVNPLKK